MPPDPQRQLNRLFDVLIIGGGAAGLYTALSLPPQIQIGLVTKDTLSLSASDWAQGGIAAALDSADSPQLHAQDTLAAGAGLCDPTAVDFLVQQAPTQVQRLLEMGIGFDRQDQQLALTLEAAHSRPRVLHAADTTGKALIKTLTTQVWQRSNIHVLPETLVLNLWINPQSQRCQGVCLISQGLISWVAAPVVVLATGGGGQVFAQTTNPAVSTGDGIAMAWQAGAQLRDLEFVQFHPTALTVPGAPRFLISEAVRGEGAHLIDAAGRRFMFDYHPQGELAPRDVVSRAIFTHLQRTANPDLPDSPDHVWLDLRPIPKAQIQRRFPKILQVCRQWGIDAFQQRIPVAPAAHYWMGGIVADLAAQTSIPGLYAVGEVASTGVHGANRLASNSLLECLVFAAQLAQLPLPMPTLEVTPGISHPPTEIQELPITDVDWSAQRLVLMDIRLNLPHLVWQSAGICRDGETMEQAIDQIEQWRLEFQQLPISQSLLNLQPGHEIKVTLPDPNQQIRTWTETSNLLDVAYLILKSALFRTESRGGHYRRDYPQVDPAWQVHTLVQDQTWRTTALRT